MMTISLGDVPFREVAETMDRTFRQVAVDKGLDFTIEQDPNLPASIHTDSTRLQQVLKNLLGNAFKFTATGGVTLKMETAAGGWTPGHETLDRAPGVIAFSVADTGIGIPDEKQRLIFEAFQQADASTTRKYGGTGLGLSISREIARLLGGEIRVSSEENVGSTFTLYLPASYVAPRERKDSLAGLGQAPMPVREEAKPTQTGQARVPVLQGEDKLVVEEQLPDDRE